MLSSPIFSPICATSGILTGTNYHRAEWRPNTLPLGAEDIRDEVERFEGYVVGDRQLAGARIVGGVQVGALHDDQLIAGRFDDANLVDVKGGGLLLGLVAGNHHVAVVGDD